MMNIYTQFLNQLGQIRRKCIQTQFTFLGFKFDNDIRRTKSAT